MSFCNEDQVIEPLGSAQPVSKTNEKLWLLGIGIVVAFAFGLIAYFCFFGAEAFAQGRLPGDDATDKLEAAGTLLKIIDTGLFKWGARIFAGICIMSSAWALKEQRFGIAIICIIGAIIFGTAPTWVKNSALCVHAA